MNIRRSVAFLFVAVAIVAAAGCTASAATPVKTSAVTLPRSYRFDPVSIEVPAGTTVTWTNADNFTHSVALTGTSDVHVMKPGETASIAFDQPGTYAYICTFHTQNMKGTVTVVP